MVYAAVLAGGKGLRMGGELPKQFVCLDGRPVIIRSIDAFLNSGRVDKIIVAVPREQMAYMQEMLDTYIGKADIAVVAGGKSRNETLRNTLEAIDIEKDDIILTHDAVRPFINKRIIDENIAAAASYGACNTVVPAVDTMLQSDDGAFIKSVPDRSKLFHAQTPQSFNACKLYKLYQTMTAEEYDRYTDACSVFIDRGEPVFMVQGDRNNIKLTYPEDMEKAETIIKHTEASV